MDDVVQGQGGDWVLVKIGLGKRLDVCVRTYAGFSTAIE